VAGSKKVKREGAERGYNQKSLFTSRQISNKLVKMSKGRYL